jgi:hypothetical protein
VAAGGGVAFMGTLADGSAATLSSSLSPNGLWPCYVSLYQGKGLLIGWVGITNQTLTGMEIDWVKLPGAGGKYYPSGFGYAPEARGEIYVAAEAGKPMLNWSNGVAALGGGGLAANLTNTITVNANHQVQVTGANPDQLKLTLASSAGTFSGSFQPAGAKQAVSFKGVVLQGLGQGGGFFRGTNQSGFVSLGPE